MNKACQAYKREVNKDLRFYEEKWIQAKTLLLWAGCKPVIIESELYWTGEEDDKPIKTRQMYYQIKRKIRTYCYEGYAWRPKRLKLEKEEYLN